MQSNQPHILFSWLSAIHCSQSCHGYRTVSKHPVRSDWSKNSAIQTRQRKTPTACALSFLRLMREEGLFVPAVMQTGAASTSRQAKELVFTNLDLSMTFPKTLNARED